MRHSSSAAYRGHRRLKARYFSLPSSVAVHPHRARRDDAVENVSYLEDWSPGTVGLPICKSSPAIFIQGKAGKYPLSISESSFYRHLAGAILHSLLGPSAPCQCTTGWRALVGVNLRSTWGNHRPWTDTGS